ncbi:MAG: hypothetical protein HUU21_29335, partial [Polyangiaceae bacterium]|nr:hypothetical protein [Polyangiaceae bacterium]
SAAAASDAAAAAEAQSVGRGPLDRAPKVLGRQTDPREIRSPVEIFWFEQGLAARLRQSKSLRDTLEAAPRTSLKRLGEAAPSAAEVRERLDVSRAITRGRTIDGEDLGGLLSEGVDEEGCFTPPLVVASGELAFPFDEQELLKVTVSVVTPLVGVDKRLKEAVDSAAELSRSTFRAPGEVVSAHLVRIREAFGQTSRALTWEALQSYVERLALEGRSYQRRALLGSEWIRGALGLSGGRALVPSYLPSNVGTSLPLIQRLPVRLIAELRPRQDELEQATEALFVVALGRVVQAPRQR